MYSVAELEQKLGVKSYVIKFWENNFPQIHPTINDDDKFYSQRDLEIFQKIKKYLHEEQLSVEETQNKLEEIFKISDSNGIIIPPAVSEDHPRPEITDTQLLRSIVEDIDKILKNLRSGLE